MDIKLYPSVIETDLLSTHWNVQRNYLLLPGGVEVDGVTLEGNRTEFPKLSPRTEFTKLNRNSGVFVP